MTLRDHVELAIPATPLSTRMIGPWIRAVIELGHGPEVADQRGPGVELALVELCTNIAVHGYRSEGGRIELAARPGDDRLRVTVVDRGSAFDPASISDPDEVQVHGYGLMIIRQLADAFDITRADGQNRWTLEFGLPGMAGASDAPDEGVAQP